MSEEKNLKDSETVNAEELQETVQAVPEKEEPAEEAPKAEEIRPETIQEEEPKKEEAEPAEAAEVAPEAEEPAEAVPVIGLAAEAMQEEAPEEEEKSAEPEKKKEKKPCGLVRFFLNSSSIWALIGKCILLLLIPYAWLFVGGFLFETLLKMYDKALVVAVIALILLAASLTLIVIAIVRYVKGKKK